MKQNETTNKEVKKTMTKLSMKEQLRVALSTIETLQKQNSKRVTQKENSDFFTTKKNEVFKFNNLNEVSKHVENHAEDYLKVLRIRLNKETFTSIEFKTQLIIDLNKVTE